MMRVLVFIRNAWYNHINWYYNWADGPTTKDWLFLCERKPVQQKPKTVLGFESLITGELSTKNGKKFISSL